MEAIGTRVEAIAIRLEASRYETNKHLPTCPVAGHVRLSAREAGERKGEFNDGFRFETDILASSNKCHASSNKLELKYIKWNFHNWDILFSQLVRKSPL